MPAMEGKPDGREPRSARPVPPRGAHLGNLGLRTNPKSRTFARNLFASDHCIALYFDLSARNGQRGDCDESAAWEIVAEYFPADLREAIAVANVRNKYRHLNHITELAARLFGEYGRGY